MTIHLHPVKIEAHDEAGDLVFSLEVFDSMRATLDIEITLTRDNLDEVLTAIRAGFDMLELEPIPK